jgi:hypothetical protein
MSLRIRRLELRVATDGPQFGATLRFDDGLCVLHAGNSMGKSTCMQAILFALGLEGMLTSKHAPPFADVMTKTIEDDEGKPHTVLESSVLLEIENGRGDAWTIQRAIRSATVDTKLIHTWLGPQLSAPTSSFPQRDHYVRMEGAAQRPDGFHFALANFIGWSLPKVARHQGNACPLYLEYIFPLVHVEQRYGWMGIQGRMPTQFGVKDPGKRAIEFLLDLDQQRVEKIRDQLERESFEIKAEWSIAVRSYEAAAGNANGVVRDLPRQPVADWPPAVPPQIAIAVGDSTATIAEVLTASRAELRKVTEEEIPRVEQVASQLSESLSVAQQNVLAVEAVIGRLYEDIEGENANVDSIDARLSAVEEDLRHHSDLERLQALGSELGLSVAKGQCPTCRQHVDDNLVEQRETMSIEENITLLKKQKATLQAMRVDAERVLGMRQARLQASRERVDELRGTVRSIRRALTADGRAPSEAAIRARLHLEQKVKTLAAAAEASDRAVTRLDELATSWRRVQGERAKLRDELSPDDQHKLELLERSVVSQLGEYQFQSFPPRELHISRSIFRPVREDFDLSSGFELSASDMIRLIWAYLLGFLEVARSAATNHPGVLVLDEPRQQSASRVSFATFLGRASRASAAGQQVIVATSEERAVLEGALQGVPHSLHSVDGRILKPIE